MLLFHNIIYSYCFYSYSSTGMERRTNEEMFEMVKEKISYVFNRKQTGKMTGNLIRRDVHVKTILE